MLQEFCNLQRKDLLILHVALNTVHNLGLFYANQGRLVEAEEMYMRALNGREKTLGSDHTSTLQTVSRLDSLYKDQGKLKEAEEVYHRALEGCPRTRLYIDSPYSQQIS
jgi:tetratricopeptide (TPR) repeat protein